MVILIYISRMVKKLNKSLKAIVYSKECYIVLWVGIDIFIVYMTPSKFLFDFIWVVRIRKHFCLNFIEICQNMLICCYLIRVNQTGDLLSTIRIFKKVLSPVLCWDLKRWISTCNNHYNYILNKSLHLKNQNQQIWEQEYFNWKLKFC